MLNKHNIRTKDKKNDRKNIQEIVSGNETSLTLVLELVRDIPVNKAVGMSAITRFCEPSVRVSNLPADKFHLPDRPLFTGRPVSCTDSSICHSDTG
jgi:hypothetical protein